MNSITIISGKEVWKVEFLNQYTRTVFEMCETMNGDDLLNELICEDWVTDAYPIAQIEVAA